MERIKCSVENCVYWSDNICRADSIQVATVQVSPSRAGRGDMEVGSRTEQDKADYSSETQCVTFRPKDKQK
ncbi:MAG: DUF1540 domain-containing protein [Firmicutes bacterium]|nr:DUF1540 domain-containing protein [Bacillota bacterium]